jgi:hypothetical protein
MERRRLPASTCSAPPECRLCSSAANHGTWDGSDVHAGPAPRTRAGAVPVPAGSGSVRCWWVCSCAGTCGTNDYAGGGARPSARCPAGLSAGISAGGCYATDGATGPGWNILCQHATTCCSTTHVHRWARARPCGSRRAHRGLPR